ncbi:unnamed protein product [Plutella xylostella]|uniref:(diamondback moth) hypothetical protein n=1 Tax=Plutella xylostella TaxID=51655 RepID=A0A8S4FUW5_PLUXY|nr:unnamed protein product [Plutella xylostella]
MPAQIKTLGEIAVDPPPDDDVASLNAILSFMEENFPSDWRTWEIYDHSYADLFGDEIQPAVEAKLRFAIPNQDLARAFGLPSLSERSYRQARRKLCTWAIGRALIYSPHSIMQKIHDRCYSKFMDVVAKIKAKITPVRRARSSAEKSTTQNPDSPGSQQEVLRKRSLSPPAQSNRTKRRKSNSMEQGSSDHLLATVLQQQMEMFNKLLQVSVDTNQNLRSLGEQLTHDQNQNAPQDEAGLLNASFESTPDSTADVEVEPEQVSETEQDHSAPVNSASRERDLNLKISELQHELNTLRRSQQATEAEEEEEREEYDFEPTTVEKEAKFSKADPRLLKQGIECQRLRSQGWENIRYSEVQKQFQASPAFLTDFEKGGGSQFVCIAGQLQTHIDEWEKCGAPKTILKILTHGYRIPFKSKPVIVELNEDLMKRYQTKQSGAMSTEIQKMLSTGAIQRSKCRKGFLSTMFLRKKTDGSNRTIFNLKRLNNFVATQKFRLLNHQKIPTILGKEYHMMKIDISQAYYHVPIHVKHRPFLSLAYGGETYQMTCLPFGLSSAPSIFSKITNWLAHSFRQQGIKTIVYLDDFLIVHQDPQILQTQKDYVVQHLNLLGWTVNNQKSSIVPVKRLEYLGIVWDTGRNIKCLAEKKVVSLQSEIKAIVRKNCWSWHEAKVILGKLNFAAFVVPLGRLHCRKLQRIAVTLPEQDKYSKFKLQPHAVADLTWWVENAHKSTAIHHPTPTLFITTDAADSGWGATVNGKKFWGPWLPNQNHWHSNYKELWTVYEVLKCLGPQLKEKSLMLQSDNRTAVAYLTKEGGTKSLKLLEITTLILTLCQRRKCHITARYLPGIYNGIADGLSRLKSLPEWTLSQEATSMVFEKLDYPEIDLFATSRSAILPAYVSEEANDTQSQFVDAFSRKWEYKLGWIFPPPSMIPRVLHHLNDSKGTYLLVAPVWEKPHWKTDLLKRALRPPLLIPNLRNYLTDLRTNQPPPAVEQLNLAVWMVRAGPIM